MGSVLRRVLPLIAAAAIAAVVAGCGASMPGTVAVHGGGPAPTRRVYVSPVTSTGAAVSGYRVTAHAAGASCEPGSEAVGQAYRCFAGNFVYDPCWGVKAGRPAVLCVAGPWQRTAAELTVSSPLTAIPAQGAAAGEPWGVQLDGGQRCLLVQGAHSDFDGHVIDYACPGNLALLRGLDRRTDVWTARSVLTKSGKPAAGPAEKIAIAWYGRADEYH
jgi:hypothetical protein